MKKVIAFVFLLSFFFEHAYPESNTSPDSTQDNNVELKLNELIQGKAKLIGQKVGFLYEQLSKINYPIKNFSVVLDYGWNQPDGKNYVKGLLIYDRTDKEIEEEKDVLLIEVSLNYRVEDDKSFWHDLPDENFLYNVKQRTKDITIKDISYQKTKMYF